MINKNIENINNINYYSFEAFSYGKIIISGEHSVVYGKRWAICFPMNHNTLP